MPATADGVFMRDYQSRLNMFPGSGMYTPPIIGDLKGKGKMIELDETKWEEQFREFETMKEDEEANKAIDKELDNHENEQFFGDFESIWNGIRAEDIDHFDASDMDFVDRFDDDRHDTSDVFDGKPDLGDYLFEPENPYMVHPDPFTEGVRLAEHGGSLSEAALCFEAVCQRNSTRTEAWAWLGSIQAQNEKELAAIRALEQCIRMNDQLLPALLVHTDFSPADVEPRSVIYQRRIRYSRVSHVGAVAEYQIPIISHGATTTAVVRPLQK
jgi:hypothetical protein